MVGVRVAAAGPPDDRHVQALKRLHHVLAIAVDVRNRRIRPNPDSVLDPAAELLCELAEDLGSDLWTRGTNVDRRRRVKLRMGSNWNKREQSSGGQHNFHGTLR